MTASPASAARRSAVALLGALAALGCSTPGGRPATPFAPLVEQSVYAPDAIDRAAHALASGVLSSRPERGAQAFAWLGRVAPD